MSLRPLPLVLSLGLCLGSAAAAEDFVPVTEVDRFLALVEGRELRLPLAGITLVVTPDGRIDGTAGGWDVTGSWDWQDGHFCREMDWSGTEIAYNCQLVEARGTDRMRFTVDRGTGRAATFRLQ